MRAAITIPRTVYLGSRSRSFPLARAVHSVKFTCPEPGCYWEGRLTPNPFFERRDGANSKDNMDRLFGAHCQPLVEWEASNTGYDSYPGKSYERRAGEPLQYVLGVLVYPQSEEHGQELGHYPVDASMKADTGMDTLNPLGKQELKVRARLEGIYPTGSHVPRHSSSTPPTQAVPLSSSSPKGAVEKQQSSDECSAQPTPIRGHPSTQGESQLGASPDHAARTSSQAASNSTSSEDLPDLSATMTAPVDSMMSADQAAFAVGVKEPEAHGKGKGRDGPLTAQAQGLVFLTSPVPAERVPHDIESYRQAMNRRSALGLEVMTMEQLSGNLNENLDLYKQVFFHDNAGNSGDEVVMVDGVLEGPDERARRARARDLSSRQLQGTYSQVSHPTGNTPSVSPTLAFWQMGTALHSQPPAGFGGDITADSAQDQPATEWQKRRKRDWVKEQYDKARSHCSPN